MPDSRENSGFNRTQPQNSDAYFRRLFDEAPLGYQSLNSEGQFLAVNQAWLNLLGYEKDQVLGKSFTDFIDPKFRDKFAANFPAFLERGSIRDIQFNMIHREGFPVTVSFNGLVSRDPENDALCTHCILEDLTEKISLDQERANLAQRNTMILNALHGAIVGFDPGGHITFINPAVTQLTGWHEEDLLGYLAHEMFHQKHEDGSTILPVECGVCGAIARKEFSRGEEIYRRSDGSTFPVEFFVQPNISEGEYSGGVLSFEDISERNAAQNRLADSEQLHRHLFENAPVSLWLEDFSDLKNYLDALKASGVKDLDAYFRDHPEALTECAQLVRVVDINQASMDLHEATSKQELIDNLHTTFTPEALTVFQKEIVALAKGELGISSETTLKTIDGRLRNVLINIFRDPGKQDWSSSYVAITDITQAKRTEEINTMLVTAIEQSAESVVITDPEGCIQYVNKSFERVTGYTRDEALGQNPSLLKSGQHSPSFYKEMWETITRGEVWQGHLINRHRDGSLFEEEASISPLLDSEGNIINFVSSKRDVTHEMELERRLVQSQKLEAVGQLAGGVAHDFNNILQAMFGHLDFAMDPNQNRDQVDRELQDLAKGVERAAALTRQLLAFSRRQVLDLQKVEPNELIAQLLKMMRRLIGENIKLVFNPGILDSAIWADPGQTEQVIVNLCINARDAMPDGGELLIETKITQVDADFQADYPWAVSGQYVELRVSDTGCGMSPEVLEQIFEPFFTTKETGRGTGLGLATVYGIIKQHRGIILADSEPGRGTTFRVLLPLAEEAIAEGSAQAGADVSPPPGGNETILLAEDDDQVRDVIDRILTRAGYRVIKAYDGRNGLEMFMKHQGEIQLALLDMVMPRMGGRVLAQKIREVEPDLKVLFNSGYTSDSTTSGSSLPDEGPLMQKPVDAGALLRKMRELLDAP